MSAAYRGRFAPSPTGPLHAGSLVAALASFLDARAHGGCWLLRIDDLDTPRTVAGAEAAIRAELRRVGLHPDEPPRRQRDRSPHYAQALDALRATGQCFDCGCTRRELGGGPYPGTCRGGLAPGRLARTVRVRVGTAPVGFEDRLCGPVCVDLQGVCGDFIVRRADGIHAYHLATVVDDAAAGVTHVVRGADLLEATGAQIHLQALLGLPRPSYAHVPVLCGDDGRKLGKQNQAAPTSTRPVVSLWRDTLQFLGLDPPVWAEDTPTQQLSAWAVAQWRARHLARV